MSVKISLSTLLTLTLTLTLLTLTLTLSLFVDVALQAASILKNHDFENLQSSLDALDRLSRPHRPRVVGAVLNNSFQKG